MPRGMWVQDKPAMIKATVESARAHLASGNLSAALVAIRKLHETNPTAESQAFYREVIAFYMQIAINQNDGREFERHLKTSAKLGDDPEWQFQRAQWLALHGDLPQALMMLPADASESQRQLLIAHTADRCIRYRTYADLPDEHHDGCKNTILAFAKYEKGDDDAARELLQSIGLQSPFLEWKMLLRGLTAFSANDDAKARENWARLNPHRLPAKLVQALRAKVDPEFLAKINPATQSLLNEKVQSLLGGKAEVLIGKLQKAIGNPEKSLDDAWPIVEALWAELKPKHPHLADRLARGMLEIMIRQGGGEDTIPYTRIFGRPKDDPDFWRTQGKALENAGQLEPAIAAWERYERWLGKKPAGWQPAEIARARALVLVHVAGLVEELKNEDDDDLDPMQIFSRQIQRMMDPKYKPHSKPATDYLQQAMQLDPDALEPRIKCLELLAADRKYAEVVPLAKATLKLAPENVTVLGLLAEALAKTKQFDEAYAARSRALKLNPLDKRLAYEAVMALEGLARHKLAQGEAEAALALLDSESAGSDFNLHLNALRVTVLLKLRRRDDAETLRARLFELPRGRLSVRLLLSVDAALAGLKPAEKTAANKDYNAEMAKPASVPEIFGLWLAHRSLVENGIDYRGSKSIDKKLENLLKTDPDHYDAGDFAILNQLLQMQGNPKLAVKVLQRYLMKFPDRVWPKVAFAEAQLQGKPNWRQRHNAVLLLDNARKILEANGDPEANALKPRIEELIESHGGFYY